MKRTLPVFLAATMFLSGAAMQRDSLAQAIPELAPVAPEEAQWRPLSVKSVPPRIVAWWLDPLHNAEPLELASARKNQPMPAPSETPKAAGAMSLPTGVQTVVPVDSQNTLLVLGTEIGTQELKKLVDFLDRPSRQVEIETQFVHISVEDVKKLPITFGQDPKTVALGKVRRSFPTALAQLVAQNEAKIIAMPRITAINNLAVGLDTSFSQSAVVSVKGADGTLRPVFSSVSQLEYPRLNIGTSFRFTVTPTINNDNTITLRFAAMRTLQFSGEGVETSIPFADLDGVQSIANVLDGDTMALTGLSSRLFAKLEDDPNAPASNVVLFVTPRIVRRAGEDDVQPVTLRR